MLLLQFAAFFSSFDRFVVAPMLVTIAAALGASLASVAATASLYYLLYGLMQPVWGILSYRLGRVRVMRLTLFGATVAGVLSAFAPNLAILVAARALAGGRTRSAVPYNNPLAYFRSREFNGDRLSSFGALDRNSSPGEPTPILDGDGSSPIEGPVRLEARTRKDLDRPGMFGWVTPTEKGGGLSGVGT